MEFVYEERYPFGRAVPPHAFADRRRAVQGRLEAEGCSSALVRGGCRRYGDLAYLTNHIPPSGTVAALHLPVQGNGTLYADVYRPDLVAVERVEPLANIPPPGDRVALLGPWLPELAPGTPVTWLDEARMIKSAAELAVLADAAVVGAIGLEAGLATALPGGTERHVGAAAVSAAIRAGADAVRCAVRAGAWTRAAARWPEISDQPIGADDLVLIDVRGSYQGFRFRAARTMTVGRAASDILRAAGAAERALAASMAALHPGAPLAAVCRAAESAAADQGDPLDPHLGHGIGYDAVESPSLDRDAQGWIRPGMVLSLIIRANPVLLVQPVAVDEAGGRALGRFPR